MGISSLTNTTAAGAQRALNLNSSKMSQALTQLSTGLRNNKALEGPSEQAIAAKLTALLGGLEQATRNAAQGAALIQLASGAQNQILGMLQQAKVMAITSASDALSSSDRAKTQTAFEKLMEQIDDTADQTRWNGVALLNGGSGTVSQPTAAVATAASTSLVNVANAFNSTFSVAAASVQGLVSGAVKDARVEANGAFYDVTIVIGEQTFKSTVSAPTSNGLLQVTSTGDGRNKIALAYNNGSVGGITNAATFESTLRSHLGLDTGIVATFSSVTSNTTQNTSANISTITAGAATAAGTYMLTYSTTDTTFRLSNGVQTWAAEFASGDTSVTFANGISVALLGTPASPTNSQHVFSVDRGSNVSLSFQVGELSTDTLTLSIAGSTLSSLGLSSASVTTITNANAALIAIDDAIEAVSNLNAELGAQQLQLEFRQSVNTITIENLGEARKIFQDTEFEKSMTAFTQYKVLAQVATSMLSQANQSASETISQLIRT
jgi:flagellin